MQVITTATSLFFFASYFNPVSRLCHPGSEEEVGWYSSSVPATSLCKQVICSRAIRMMHVFQSISHRSLCMLAELCFCSLMPYVLVCSVSQGLADKGESPEGLEALWRALHFCPEGFEKDKAETSAHRDPEFILRINSE